MLIFLLTFSIRARHQVDETDQSAVQDRPLSRPEELGLSQDGHCRREAVGMGPEKAAVPLPLVERITRDFRFSLKEEEELKKLLFAVYPGREPAAKERTESHDRRYGELAYRIGLCYWYYHEETGGRAAAARWFEKAVESRGQEERLPDWWESARIHGKIARHYDHLAKEEDETKRQETYWQFWRDTKTLWKTENFRREAAGIREQLARELLCGLIMRCGELKRRGERREELLELLGELLDFAERSELSDGRKDKIRRQCQKAKLAVDQAFPQNLAAEKASAK